MVYTGRGEAIVSAHQWDENYRQGTMPWDTADPDPTLVGFVQTNEIEPGRALDIGCGTGTHALWLAERGFDVVGIDISTEAIALARAKGAAARVAGAIRFEVLDFLEARPDGGPFDLVLDRGVFHLFDAADERAAFAAQVAACLAESGHWLSLIGSTEGAPRDQGPPRRSARDIADAIEPALAIVELRATHFDLDRAIRPAAWACVSRRRAVPAQPSTR